MRSRLQLIGAALAATLAGSALAQQANPPVVISQVYGGGGNTAATYLNDFIELYNRSSNPVTIGGWMVQYASATGSFSTTSATQKTEIPAGVVLQPGQYYLIQEASGGAIGATLPTADLVATSPINMAGASGKVILLNNNVAIGGGSTGTCPALYATGTLVDSVSYGTVSCFEGAGAAPGLGNTTAAVRGNGGCTDTNSNSADFSAQLPNPRNSSTITPCTPATPPSGTGSSAPSPVCRNTTVTMTVTVTLGTAPSSPIASVVGDTTQIGGAPGVAFLDDGVAPDAVAGDSIYTAQATIGGAVAFANLTVPVVITDNLNRPGSTGVAVTVANCDPRGTGSASPSGVCEGGSALISVNVTGGINPPSTGLQVIVDLTSIGGSGSQALVDDGTSGDVTAGDNVFSYLATVAVPAGGPYALSGVVLDAQGRAGALNTFNANVVSCTPATSTIVISQVYGGGGNTGSLYFNDFIELFNRGSSTVTLDGMSLQLAGASAGFDRIANLTGSVAPGQYFLVRCSRGNTGGSAELPIPADLLTPETGTGSMTVGSTAGRVALVSSTTLLGVDCATRTDILDLVGYGGGSTCFEGGFTCPTTSNPVALIRVNGGCQDFNQNSADFIVAAPSPRNTASPLNNCNPNTCPQDFNHDNEVNPDDLGDFITCYFTEPPCPGADFNADNDVNPDDLGDFITAYFGPGC